MLCGDDESKVVIVHVGTLHSYIPMLYKIVQPTDISVRVCPQRGSVERKSLHCTSCGCGVIQCKNEFHDSLVAFRTLCVCLACYVRVCTYFVWMCPFRLQIYNDCPKMHASAAFTDKNKVQTLGANIWAWTR